MMKNLSFFEAKGANPQRIFHDKLLSQDSVDIIHARIGANLFTDRKNPKLKVSIPFEHASIHATWQTASGHQKHQQVKGNHVSIMPADLAYETRWEQTSEIIILCFQPAFMATVAEDLVIGNTVEMTEQWTAIDPFIRQLGFTLRHELQTGFLSRLYIDSLTTVLAIHLLRHYSTVQLKTVNSAADLPERSLHQITDYMESNLEQDLSLERLSQLTNLSLYQFARAFKKSMGLPPHQYLLQRRIERAKHLLSQTRLPIYDISYQLGFSNQSHFSTTFRRLTGTTPKAYRQSL